MGVVHDIKEAISPTANPATGQTTSVFQNPLAQNAPGSTTSIRQAITDEERDRLARTRLGDTSKGREAEGFQVDENGNWTRLVTFANPEGSGPPTFRAGQEALTTAALNQQGIRNPVNAMRAAQTPRYGGAQVDTQGTEYAQLLGLQDRNSQQDALRMQRQAAMGRAPSVAAIQQQQGLDAAINGQFALANSARGGAAQRGVAQHQAAQQAGAIQQAGINQAAALRAGEMAQARGAFGAQADQMRAGDAQQAGLASQMALGQAGFTQQAQMGNADRTAGMMQADQKALLGQQALDDQRALGLLTGLQNTDQMTLQAQQQAQADRLQLLAIQAGVATDNNQRQGQFVQSAVGGGMNALGAMFGMGF